MNVCIPIHNMSRLWLWTVLLTGCLSPVFGSEEKDDLAFPPPGTRDAKPPQLVKPVNPVYPLNMRASGIEGAVVVEFIVDKEGRVRSPHVVESNNPWFERPALNAILKWRYKPGVVEGKPVNTRVQQAITFNLNGGGSNLWAVTKLKNHNSLPLELRWDNPPIPVHTNFPIYPREELRAGTAGKVVVRYFVDNNGNVIEPTILDSTNAAFAGAALAAVDAWRFKPASRGGHPCYAMLQMTWQFAPAGQNSDSVPVSDGARRVLEELAKENPAITTASKLDRPIVPISRRPPIYPTVLRKSGEEGVADIEFYVDSNGDAQLPRILSATKPEFGFAAVQAVATWRFSPPTKDKESVITVAQIRMEFSLKDEQASGK